MRKLLLSTAQCFTSSNNSLENILQETVQSIASTWPPPAATTVKIILRGDEYVHSDQKPVLSILQKLYVQNKDVGVIEIGWTHAQAPPDADHFLLEQKDILQVLALHMETHIACRENNNQLILANEEIHQILTTISSIFISLDHDMRVKRWNPAAEKCFELSHDQAVGRPLTDLSIEWDIQKITKKLALCASQEQPISIDDINYRQQNSLPGLLGMTGHPIMDKGKPQGFLLLGADITNKKVMQAQRAQTQKLESIGQLASGIAHEINTPTQYIGDNLLFLQESFQDIQQYTEECRKVCIGAGEKHSQPDALLRLQQMEDEIDYAFLQQEMPNALSQSLEGIRQVADIVRSMKEFSHPGSKDKSLININNGLKNTIIVSKNTWKHQADLQTDLDADIPSIWAFSNGLNQAFLNIIINASQAIAQMRKEHDIAEKGTITVKTWAEKDHVFIRISDTGPGIPYEIQEYIFDPFFTTKEVGQGTGQGLYLTHQIIADEHAGSITLHSEPGKGTAFEICLPVDS